jgi:hypothetical protein
MPPPQGMRHVTRARTLSDYPATTTERIGRDSNSRYAFTYTHFPDRKNEGVYRSSRGETHKAVSGSAHGIYSISGWPNARQIVHVSYTTRISHQAGIPLGIRDDVATLLRSTRAHSRTNQRLIRADRCAFCLGLLAADGCPECGYSVGVCQ